MGPERYDHLSDAAWFQSFKPIDALEKRLVRFVVDNNNFAGDDVRALLRRIDRMRAEAWGSGGL